MSKVSQIFYRLFHGTVCFKRINVKYITKLIWIYFIYGIFTQKKTLEMIEALCYFVANNKLCVCFLKRLNLNFCTAKLAKQSKLPAIKFFFALKWNYSNFFKWTIACLVVWTFKQTTIQKYIMPFPLIYWKPPPCYFPTALVS